MRSIAIIGASLAGTSAAEALREAGFDGSITLLEAGSMLAPDRPPLSKQVLTGEQAPETAVLPAAAQLEELSVELRTGVTVEHLDVSDRALTLAGGERLRADGIVIASGASPRRLPTGLAGVHVLRGLEDCLAIRADLAATTERVVVIGAGFIGAEVAASCRQLGREVTLIEVAPLPLQRVMPGPIGGFVADLHRDHGVDVRLGVGVDRLEGGARVERVVLADGTAIDCGLVVVGIGVVPNTGFLEGSGLALDDGVRCDATCLAAPGVVAAGDVARWPNARFQEVMRVEQWENAIDQGGHAARRLLAGDAGTPFSPVPWFWSDQYDRKIQMAGRVAAGDEMRLVEGSVEERRFVALFRRGGHCSAVLGVNRPRHVIRTRLALNEGPLGWADALAAFELTP